MFLLYVQDLISKLTVDCSLYADDLKLSRKIASSADVHLWQADLHIVAHWGTLNSLHLNSSKCQVITFSRRRSSGNEQRSHTLAASQLTRVSEVRDLGVYLDVKLDFRRHTDRVIARCRSTLGLVKRFAKEFGDLEVAKPLYRALVRPIAEYAAPVWTPYHRLTLTDYNPSRSNSSCSR